MTQAHLILTKWGFAGVLTPPLTGSLLYHIMPVTPLPQSLAASLKVCPKGPRMACVTSVSQTLPAVHELLSPHPALVNPTPTSPRFEHIALWPTTHLTSKLLAWRTPSHVSNLSSGVTSSGRPSFDTLPPGGGFLLLAQFTHSLFLLPFSTLPRAS